MIPHFGSDGEVLGICLLIRDISEQKRIEEALRWSEQRFRDFAEASSDWFWETDLEQRFTYLSSIRDPVSARARDRNLIGKARAQVHDKFGVDESVVPRIQAFMDRAESFRGVEVRITRGGFPVEWLQLSGQPVFDETGELQCYRGMAIDITERKRANEALRESEGRYRSLAQLLPDAVRVMTGDRVVFANAAAADLLSAESPEKLVGLPTGSFIDSDDQKELLDRVARVERGESVPWREQTLRAFGDRLVTVESAMSPIIWDGKRSRLVVNRDTTRHKRVENQLRHAMEQAEQANVAKSRFLAAASHDLRQPIQALGLLNAALAYEVDDPSQKEITSNMGHAIDAMRSVLDGLLDISKLEAGVVTPELGARSSRRAVEHERPQRPRSGRADHPELRVQRHPLHRFGPRPDRLPQAGR
jgi:PAS domain S-box-containing protein